MKCDGSPNPGPRRLRRRPAKLAIAVVIAVVALVSCLLCTSTPVTEPTEAVGATTQINVRHYGAKGNGSANDTQAFVAAMRAAVNKGLRLYVPKGTYSVSRLVLPTGLVMEGAGSSRSRIKGQVVFGSRQTISGLRLGRAGYSTHGGYGAHDTTFVDCRFRGGGGRAGSINAPVIALGYGANVSRITFRRCRVERNLGRENRRITNCYNNVTVLEQGPRGQGHMDSITFIGCHVGVSNGRTDIPRNIGSPRAGLECYTWHGGDKIAAHGWSNLKVIDCVFEATDSFCIDLADYPLPSGERASGPALISGCTLKGGGYNDGIYGYTICCEAPKGVTIENNVIYRARDHALHVTGSGGQLSSGYVIRNNVFALDVANGVIPEPASSYYSHVHIMGPSHTFTGNTITTNRGGLLLELQNCTNCTVSGNTLNELRTSNPPWALNIWDTRGCVISGNTFRTAASTNPVIHYQGTNTNNTLTNNGFVHN